MTPKVERTSAPQAAKKSTAKKKTESNKQVFDYGNKNNQPTAHTVEQSETAFAIARKYNISIHELAEANGWKYTNKQLIDGNGNVVNLSAGIKIKLPGNNNAAKTQPQKSEPPRNNKIYTVKKGDNFTQIAEANNISIRQLAAANGLTVKQDKNGIKVLKNGQSAALTVGSTIHIPASVTANMKDLPTLNDVQKQTKMTDGFVNVIKKHEGNPRNDFKPYTKAYKDDNGVWTVGYGYTKGVTAKTTMTEAQANAQLAKNYLQIQADLKIELGDDVYNKMPAPLREGLIDLVFNKGFDALDTNKFKAAINKGDIASAVTQLIFTKSVKTGEDMSGLYKRSLARIAMVYEGLDSESKKKVKPVIDSFYATAKSKVSENELKQWWTPNKTQGNPQQYEVKQGETFTSIAKKHGISVQELEKANPNINPSSIKYGNKIVIPLKGTSQKTKMTTQTNKPHKDKALTGKIKAMKLKDQNSYNQTIQTFNNYAQTYKLPPKAIDIFKKEAQNEFNSWFYINSDNMTAMAGILDAQKPEELLAAIKTAVKTSSKTQEFAGLALKSKININNVKALITKAGGAKEYINLVKKTGDFEIMKHTLIMLLGKTQDKNLLARFNKAQEKGDYNDIVNIYNQALAQKPEEISGQLAHTLAEDDDLNSELYKYQIGKVNDKNILQVLKSNDIISGICEAENDRSKCKTEITKLLKILNNNYKLNPKKKQEFLQLIDKEFRPRSVNPATWWIATSKISQAFKDLIADATPIKKVFSIQDAEQKLFKELGLPNGTESIEKITDEKGNIKPLIHPFKPKPGQQGKLTGKLIVINSGHGGYNPKPNSKNEYDFDKGALGNNAGTKIHEWSLNRYMANKVIKELLKQGAEVILTSGHINSVAYQNLDADMTISLHADSHNGTSGPRLYSHEKDPNDKILANKILNRFITNNKHVLNLTDLKRADKMHKFTMQTNDTTKKSMQIVSNDSNLQILRRDNKNPSNEPSILIEYCNMQKQDEIIDIVTGNLGKDMVNSIVNGIIEYWE